MSCTLRGSFWALHEPCPADGHGSAVEAGSGAAGFGLSRQRGSHQIYRHAETGKRVSVPFHPGDVPKGTLRQILRDAELSIERFLALQDK